MNYTKFTSSLLIAASSFAGTITNLSNQNKEIYIQMEKLQARYALNKTQIAAAIPKLEEAKKILAEKQPALELALKAQAEKRMQLENYYKSYYSNYQTTTNTADRPAYAPISLNPNFIALKNDLDRLNKEVYALKTAVDNAKRIIDYLK